MKTDPLTVEIDAMSGVFWVRIWRSRNFRWDVWPLLLLFLPCMGSTLKIWWWSIYLMPFTKKGATVKPLQSGALQHPGSIRWHQCESQFHHHRHHRHRCSRHQRSKPFVTASVFKRLCSLSVFCWLLTFETKSCRTIGTNLMSRGILASKCFQCSDCLSARDFPK